MSVTKIICKIETIEKCCCPDCPIYKHNILIDFKWQQIKLQIAKYTEMGGLSMQECRHCKQVHALPQMKNF